VRAGELLAVVGPVASGKSSLLAAMLGEVRLVAGSVERTGGSAAPLALCAQQPWVLNDTLRANVLFGAPHDADRLAAVLDACALRPDLAALPLGELTEVGERGVTLSGGQKARVCLARAAYAAPCATAVLLDDPLAAVDAHVGEHIFARAIVGLMRGATRVLVTNGSMQADAFLFDALVGAGDAVAAARQRAAGGRGGAGAAVPRTPRVEQALRHALGAACAVLCSPARQPRVRRSRRERYRH
jgi:ABC-type transport system involved in cytochrome bd biosynthesis fused ATPase/permease subunit